MVETKHLTIMFTDIKGFTETTSMKKRGEIENFLDLHESLIEPVFKKYNGRVVKTIGDAFMVAFHSPTNAVLCGMEIQKKLKAYDDANTEEKVEVRIAINSGEVHIRGDDIFGEAVNIASRIEGIAEANDIYFTESVYLSMNKNEIPSAEIGYRKLKGIPEEIKVYKVLKEGDIRESKEKRAKLLEKGGLSFSARLKNFWHRRKKWIIIALVLLVLIGAATNPKNIIKKESNIDTFISNAEKTIQNGNYEEAKKLADKLDQLPRESVPPKLALEGAKLNVFLRRPEKVLEYLRLAKNNSPTREEIAEINSYIKTLMEQSTPKQKEALSGLISK